MARRLKLPGSTGPAVLLLLLYAAALVWQAWTVGLTFDEPAHLMAGYMYWRGEDILKPATTAPLSHILSGWVPKIFDVPVHDEAQPGGYHDAYAISWRTFHSLSADRARRLFFCARLPFILISLLIAWLVWSWGRELAGARIAILLLAAVILEPNLLAHGPLINSDVLATFGLLWVCYACWRFWNEPCRKGLLHLSAGLAVAVLTKFTLLVMVPFVLAVVFVRYGQDRRWAKAIGAVAVVSAATYVGLVGSYQFEIDWTDGSKLRRLYAEEHFRPEEVGLLEGLVPVPLPLQFVSGVRFLLNHGLEEGQPGYMIGRLVDPPEPLYFPLAMAVKYPIPLQLLLLGGLALLVWRIWKQQANAADFFIWAPPAILFGVATTSHMLPGLRYVLPAVPLFILGGGLTLQGLWARRSGRAATLAGLAWLTAASMWIYPQGLAYFNEWIRGPDHGWKYLADSNIDWGQDLPLLARYVQEHKIEKIKLAYFGEDYPDHYFDADRFESIPNPFCLSCVKERVLTPEPGVYAISVNMLLGYFWPEEYRDYFRYFRERRPDAKAGYSIFIYDLQ